MADVFISYAREDRPRAEQIARMFQGMGLECFWDTEIPPGQTWADYIEGKLSACKAVIVLWSEHSTRSQWVREEARMGRDKGRLIPAMLDGSQPPFGFGEVQAANLANWTGDPNNPEWQRLSNAVVTAVRNAGGSPQPQAAASTGGWTTSSPQPVYGGATGAAENLSFVGYVQKCLRLYIDGKGRARRAEYWWWALFVGIAYFIAAVIDVGVGGVNYAGMPNSQIVTGIVGLALLAPGVSVMSRRFHDVGLNGWLVAAFFAAYVVGYALSMTGNILGNLVVLAAGIAALVFLVRPGQPGTNQYGPNPKGV